MITAEFFIREDEIIGFKVYGHADYADIGEDVVCAGVSSAVMLTANTITENFSIAADITAIENEISLTLHDGGKDKNAKLLLEALRTHLGIIAQEYEGTISILNLEV